MRPPAELSRHPGWPAAPAASPGVPNATCSPEPSPPFTMERTDSLVDRPYHHNSTKWSPLRGQGRGGSGRLRALAYVRSPRSGRLCPGSWSGGSGVDHGRLQKDALVGDGPGGEPPAGDLAGEDAARPEQGARGRVQEQRRLREHLDGGRRGAASATASAAATTVTLAQRSPDARFTSVDVSADSIAEAKRRADRAGLTNVEFRQ